MKKHRGLGHYDTDEIDDSSFSLEVDGRRSSLEDVIIQQQNEINKLLQLFRNNKLTKKKIKYTPQNKKIKKGKKSKKTKKKKKC